MVENRLTTDDSRWPILVHETVGMPPRAHVDAMIRRSNEALERGEPYVVIFDNRQAGPTPSYLREAAIKWMKENRDRLGQHCLGSALVIRSPALRFLMATVMLLAPSEVKQEVYGTIEEAYDWAERRLREAAGARRAR